MRKIIILGAGVYQVPLIRAAKKMGLTVIVASIKGEYPGFALADKVYYINTTDKEAILEMAVRENADGICTTGTDVAVSTIGYVCEHMGLSGISEEAASIVTDKAQMKAAFRKSGVATAEFRKVYSYEEAYMAAEEIGFPVVVKCVDSSGSRGVTIVNEEPEFKAAYARAVHQTSKDYVLVEKKLTGKEIGVDGVVQDGKIVFLAPHDKLVYRSDKATIPVGHCFPYQGSETIQKELRHQMELAVTAAGLDNCFFNADVFVDEDSAFLIELGGRTGATCIPELISMYYGFDFYTKILESAMGLKPDFFEKKEEIPCMAKLLMSPMDGQITFVDEEKLDELREEGIEIELDFQVDHGVEKMENGTNRFGHVVAAAENQEKFEIILDRVYKSIYIDGRSLEELWRE